MEKFQAHYSLYDDRIGRVAAPGIIAAAVILEGGATAANDPMPC
jgi:hypothetical protein